MGTEYIYFVAMPLNEPIVHFTQTRFNGISKSFCLPFISLPIFSLFLSFWVKRLYALLLFPFFVFFLIFDSFFLFLFVLLLSHINTNNINMTIRQIQALRWSFFLIRIKHDKKWFSSQHHTQKHTKKMCVTLNHDKIVIESTQKTLKAHKVLGLELISSVLYCV